MAAAAVRALEWAGVSEEQPRPGCSALAVPTGSTAPRGDHLVAVAKLPEPMMLMVVIMRVPPSCLGQLAVMVLPA